MINLSYSRISLADIAQKLQLDSAEDAEYIVAKAIRDNVIDATINHKLGQCKSLVLVTFQLVLPSLFQKTELFR